MNELKQKWNQLQLTLFTSILLFGDIFGSWSIKPFNCNDHSKTLASKVLLLMGAIFVTTSATVSFFINKIDRKKLFSKILSQCLKNYNIILTSAWMRFCSFFSLFSSHLDSDSSSADHYYIIRVRILYSVSFVYHTSEFKHMYQCTCCDFSRWISSRISVNELKICSPYLAFNTLLSMETEQWLLVWSWYLEDVVRLLEVMP